MNKKCFFITPIGGDESDARKNADTVLKYIIEPVFKQYGYDVIRADTMHHSGLITKAIIENVITSDIVVADLTGSNPNVFYELAIRHSFKKPAIQIKKDDLLIPFDIANMKTVKYDTSLEGAEKAKQEIGKSIQSIEEGEKINNPVSEVDSIIQLSENSDSDNAEALSDLLLQVQQIPDKLDSMEKSIETRFSQMLSSFVETMRTSNTTGSVEDRMMEMFLQKLFENPQQGVKGFTALMDLEKKINNDNK